MRRTKAFLETVWIALTQPGSYEALRKRTFWSGFWYLYFLFVLTTFVAIVPVSVAIIAARPMVRELVEDAKRDAPGLYPPALVVTVKNAEVSTNVEEPYVIDLPPKWAEKTGMFDEKETQGDESSHLFEHLLTIDTKATAEDYLKYRSIALITKRSIVFPDKVRVMKDEKGKNQTTMSYRFQTFERVGDRVITKQTYDTILNQILPYANYLPALTVCAGLALLLVGPFLIAGIGMVGYLLYLLLTTLVLLLIALIAGNKMPYEELYKLSFYGVTLPVIVGLVCRILGVAIPLLLTLIFFVWMGIILTKLKPTPRQKAA